MKVCFPVQNDEGINSRVYNHFGSAPMFIVVDTDTGDVSAISNGDRYHVHGACNPLKALNNRKIDAVVVGGIGAGALSRLNEQGIRVYRAEAQNVGENLVLFNTQQLQETAIESCCGGHSSKSGCAHH